MIKHISKQTPWGKINCSVQFADASKEGRRLEVSRTYDILQNTPSLLERFLQHLRRRGPGPGDEVDELESGREQDTSKGSACTGGSSPLQQCPMWAVSTRLQPWCSQICTLRIARKAENSWKGGKSF